MASQEIIHDGTRALVGDVAMITVCKDPWLFDFLDPYISSNILNKLQGLLVNSLKLNDKIAWDEDVCG